MFVKGVKMSRPKGFHQTEETKRKISEGHMGIRLGKKASLETKKKMSESHKGNKNGHWRGGKVETGRGYLSIFSPEHPNKDRNQYVPEHRLLMEQKLGRYLNKKEIVHHINGNKKDNKIENLILFKNNIEHAKYHYHKRMKRSKNAICRRTGRFKRTFPLISPGNGGTYNT